jgi:multidrug resistance protein
MLMIGLSMLFSPFCANIYIVCLPTLEKAINTTPQMINLTVTVYLIFQGIAPTIFGDFADIIGRRPTYMLTFTLFVVANIGLALQSSYAALLALRILQNAGSSAATAISYAVVADIAPPAERGEMLGQALVATNIGIIIGPLLGGVLADTVGWRWIFWLLAILGGIFLFVLSTFFPETARNIVGSGNLEVGPLNRTLLSYLPVKSETQTVGGEQCYHDRKRSLQRRKWLPNSLKSIRLVFYKDTSLVLSISAMAYMVFFCIQASLPGIFVDVYDLDEAQIGYSFIASGTGVVIGGYMNGMFMFHPNHNI